jgi:4-alpha-glucanotransferase
VVRLVVPEGSPVPELVLQFEDGFRRSVPVPRHVVDKADVGGSALLALEVPLPEDLPLGWHALQVRSSRAESAGRLVVTPDRLELAPPLRDGRAWGFWLQLYALRSRTSWGMGDLRDLAELAEWSARDLGADFVLVNPLHATEPVAPVSPSPYLPMSRRFGSPLYLCIEDVPEYAALPEGARSDVEALAATCRARNTTDDLIDRDLVWRAKREALGRLYAVPRDAARDAAFAAYRQREGEGLDDFATWCALAEVHGMPWRTWPEDLHQPHSAAVAAARDQYADQVRFWCWVQWVLDEQLAATRQRAEAAGMGVGVLHDLAVGVSADSADAWALQDVLALGVSVGAPPDAFNQVGQDWSQPPWRPDRLVEAGYEPYRRLLQTVLRHAGGLRIDHILGLFRLWWVPEGLGPAEGTYVTYDVDALLGILALEARRAGALVVGEDLGVVAPGTRDTLADRGILGTSLLWFEHADDGAPLPPERWRELSLATVTTHDLPPTAGYLAGEHLRVRHELGLLTRPLEEETAVNDADLAAWRALLVERGLLTSGGGVPDVDTELVALYRLLAASPAKLLGVGLPDAVGDRRIINQPGTSEEYPNWRVPLADGSGRPVLLEDVMGSDLARALAAAVAPPARSDTV